MPESPATTAKNASTSTTPPSAADSGRARKAFHALTACTRSSRGPPGCGAAASPGLTAFMGCLLVFIFYSLLHGRHREFRAGRSLLWPGSVEAHHALLAPGQVGRFGQFERLQAIGHRGAHWLAAADGVDEVG